MQTHLIIRIDGDANQASLIRAVGLVLGNVMAGGRGIDAGGVQYNIAEHGTMAELWAAHAASLVRPMAQGDLVASTDFSVGGDVDGTHLVGYIKGVPYATLVKLFGKSGKGDGYKVDAEWDLTLKSGKVATIYNWKNGKGYCGPSGLNVDAMTDWNIGGKDLAVITELSQILERRNVSHSYSINWGKDATVVQCNSHNAG